VAHSCLEDCFGAIESALPVGFLCAESIKRLLFGYLIKPTIGLGSKVFSGSVSAVADSWGGRKVQDTGSKLCSTDVDASIDMKEA
jgi:hypothetical protein